MFLKCSKCFKGSHDFSSLHYKKYTLCCLFIWISIRSCTVVSFEFYDWACNNDAKTFINKKYPLREQFFYLCSGNTKNIRNFYDCPSKMVRFFSGKDTIMRMGKLTPQLNRICLLSIRLRCWIVNSAVQFLGAKISLTNIWELILVKNHLVAHCVTNLLHRATSLISMWKFIHSKH
jgi:hypothetical protein